MAPRINASPSLLLLLATAYHSSLTTFPVPAPHLRILVLNLLPLMSHHSYALPPSPPPPKPSRPSPSPPAPVLNPSPAIPTRRDPRDSRPPLPHKIQIPYLTARFRSNAPAAAERRPGLKRGCATSMDLRVLRCLDGDLIPRDQHPLVL